MTRLFLILLLATPTAARADDGTKRASTREVGVRDNGKSVEVRPGDTLRVALPSDLRNAWTWAKLTEAPELGTPKMSTRTTAGQSVEVQVADYPVKSTPTRPKKVRWIYCRFGRPVSHLDNKTPLEPGDPIRPGRTPVEGMIFEIELKAAATK